MVKLVHSPNWDATDINPFIVEVVRCILQEANGNSDAAQHIVQLISEVDWGMLIADLNTPPTPTCSRCKESHLDLAVARELHVEGLFCPACIGELYRHHTFTCVSCGKYQILSKHYPITPQLCDQCRNPRNINNLQRVSYHNKRARDRGLLHDLTLPQWLETLDISRILVRIVTVPQALWIILFP